jgi:hypothetical protein
MSNTPQVPATKGRKLHIIIDANDRVMIEPSFGMERQFGQIAREIKPQKSAMIPGVGWILRPLLYDRYKAHERTLADPYILLPSALTLTIPSDGFFESKRYRKPSDQTGADSGAAADMPAVGDPFVVKRIPADADWSSAIYRLDADQTAFPGPTTDDSIVMDRVAVSTAPNEFFQPVAFRYFLVQQLVGGQDSPYRWYLNAAPSSDEKCRGFGNYCIQATGHGSVNVWERGKVGPDFTDIGWVFRDEVLMPWIGDAGASRDGFLQIYTTKQSGESLNGKISFGVAFATGSGKTEYVVFQGVAAYLCKHDGKGQRNPTLEKIRVDMRRSNRGGFQVSKGGYVESDEIIDDWFTLHYVPMETRTMRVEAYGSFPAGTSLDIALDQMNPSGLIVSVTQTGSGTFTDGLNVIGYWATFDTPPQRSQFRGRFTENGTGAETTMFRAVRYLRDGRYTDVSPGEIEGGTLVEFSAMGAESDFTHDNAHAHIEDLKNELAVFGVRGGECVRVETEYDAAHPEKRCILGRYYANQPDRTRHGVNGRVWPDPDWNEIQLELTGAYQRFSEVFAPVLFSWSQDPNGPVVDGMVPPYKVTDVLKAILQWAGFAADMIDLPDLAIRLFPTGSDDQMQIAPFDDLGEIAMKLARDYLGRALVFDYNRNTYGAWKVIEIPRAPYTNVAYFTTLPPANKLPHAEESYADKHITATSDRIEVTVPQRPVLKDRTGRSTLRKFIRRPECNKLTVTGSGDLTLSSKNRLTQVVHNFQSYSPDPDNPTEDKNSPDWIGRCVEALYPDEALTTPAAVDWVARRIHDVAMLGYEMATFMGHLLLITHEDDPTRERPLRFGDPVILNDRGTEKQFMVRNVNITVDRNEGGDFKQIAIYELQQPRI